MGWGWSQAGRENVPGGVQLLKDPPVDGQVLLSLGVGGPAGVGVDASVCASAGGGGG